MDDRTLNTIAGTLGRAIRDGRLNLTRLNPMARIAVNTVFAEYERRLQPYEFPALPNLFGVERRSQPYIGYLKSRILLLEKRLQGVPAHLIPRLTGSTLDTYRQELERMTGVRRPVPPPLPDIVRNAIELQQFIADLETQIEDLREEAEDLPLHDPVEESNLRHTLDSLMQELRKAKLKWDRLPPINGLPPPVPTSRRQLELHQIFPRANVAAEPRPRVIPGAGIVFETPNAPVINHDTYDYYSFGGERDTPDIPAAQTSATSRDTFSDQFRGQPTRHVGASSSTIPTSEPELQPDSEKPVPAAPPRSSPYRGPALEQADSVAQPGASVRRFILWANSFSSATSRPDLNPDFDSQEVQMETDEMETDGIETDGIETDGIETDEMETDDDGGGASSSAASVSNPQAPTSTGESESGAPVSPNVENALDDDALNEELYSDRY